MSEQTFDRSDPGTADVGIDTILNLSDRLDRVRLARLEAVAELDRTGRYREDGYASVSSFLAHRCSLTFPAAAREVGVARQLEGMAFTVKAVSVGDISVPQLEILALARRRHPGPYADDEEALVDAIRTLNLTDTRRAVQHWIDLHDDRDEEEDESRVYLAKTWKGRGRLDGDLDSETTDLLDSALDSLMSEMVRTAPKEDLRPAPQRRAEALAEMVRRFLATQAPTRHGHRPQVNVVVDWQTLTGESNDGTSELMDGTPITAAHARQLACDARVSRLLTGPDGEILDLGRSKRTVTPAQWKALRIRDRHCRWPGCRRPPAWCDAHHIRHWADHDGETDLDNLVLLCRHHHTLVHRRGWELVGTARHFTIYRPDGTQLPNAPP